MVDQTRIRPSEFPHTAFDVIAICTSAGGIHALMEILSHIGADFPAAITVVQHLSPSQPSFLAEIIRRKTQLKVKEAGEGDHLLPGYVYTAPPNHHLLVNAAGVLILSQSDPVHFVRPSADVLLQSLAVVYQDRVVAVILTGTGKDGAEGVKLIKKGGGKVLAQDEGSSAYFDMPRSAIETGCVDLVLPLDQIAAALIHLVDPGVEE